MDFIQPPDFETFRRLAAQGNVIPVAESLLADMLTPVSAYLRLCRDDEPGFLLESVEGGEKVARYSFLGRAPREQISFDGRRVVVQRDGREHSHDTDIFTWLQQRLRTFRFVPNADLPRFSGGIVGWFGYETVRLLEDLPADNPAIEGRPLARFGLYDTVLAFDHLRQQIIIITNAILEDGSDLRRSYQAALARIDEVKQRLRQPVPHSHSQHSAPADVQSNFSQAQFGEAVEKARAYIRAGDIFQVVISQRFSRRIHTDPFEIYRALRLVNPSPYLYFLHQGPGDAIIGSSPEMLVRVEEGTVTVRPIAGTRPRGRTVEEDAALARELLDDEKECAEHLMLIDLGRNDVGRVSRFGSVQVTEKMIIERYSHVMHIVSEVRGRLRPELDAIDALKACFPAGTVSGAPKVRAMEIIEELEPERRNIYSGALGYLDFSGNLDTCIAIRTLEVQENTAYFQAGAGIVADSVAEREFQETVHKSNALRRAIALAESGLQALQDG